jgi:hypothetical protein
MSICYFYDVTVYRLDEKTYYSKRAIFIDEALFPKHSSDSDALRKRDNDNPRENMGFRDHLGRIYGGCWRFNETIGFIRLHFLGSQIRGDYFSVVRKRIVRTRTKTFEYRTWKLAPEIDQDGILMPGCSNSLVLILIGSVSLRPRGTAAPLPCHHLRRSEPRIYSARSRSRRPQARRRQAFAEGDRIVTREAGLPGEARPAHCSHCKNHKQLWSYENHLQS